MIIPPSQLMLTGLVSDSQGKRSVVLSGKLGSSASESVLGLLKIRLMLTENGLCSGLCLSLDLLGESCFGMYSAFASVNKVLGFSSWMIASVNKALGFSSRTVVGLNFLLQAVQSIWVFLPRNCFLVTGLLAWQYGHWLNMALIYGSDQPDPIFFLLSLVEHKKRFVSFDNRTRLLRKYSRQDELTFWQH
jgi:hypothetical protein